MIGVHQRHRRTDGWTDDLPHSAERRAVKKVGKGVTRAHTAVTCYCMIPRDETFYSVEFFCQ